MFLDPIDRRILQVLQRDGGIQNADLASRVGLSPSPCLRRVKRLKESGMIARYVALLDPGKLGLSLTVFARVWLTGQDEETVVPFVEAVQKLPEIVECCMMAGDCDFILRIVARDLDDYRQFQAQHLGRIRGVRNIKTEIPLQINKRTTEIPLR
ncbi:Lrp/AsnC family transcriptional regulator [Methylobacterium frigidaeris]|uniref:Leucine-responsive regulatory protein n=1 Tax=Methylobacterium frigidaeris TaxID=2038277 RepID=A0AA37HJ05_9HYPH|nr:Lrp/AsnC family transcriptional regulator [Methylobacterium frigidaeris]PIK72848.1 AsnC family transcriptional regulator [Methylobacterium frigidaeris]GJD66045.1 Leucine-responsive regulatory protein [Methylobacterium frigidaeris]